MCCLGQQLLVPIDVTVACFTCLQPQQEQQRALMRAAQLLWWGEVGHRSHDEKRFKVSLYIKIPPNWVTGLLKMLQRRNALQFSRRRRLTLVVSCGTSATGGRHLLCCWRVCPPPPPTPIARHGGVLTAGSSGEPYLFIWYQKMGCESCPNAKMSQFCAAASHFSRFRDDAER